MSGDGVRCSLGEGSQVLAWWYKRTYYDLDASGHCEYVR